MGGTKLKDHPAHWSHLYRQREISACGGELRDFLAPRNAGRCDYLF
jgi:hypothetical protein